ncbi:hypothetical protein [Streptomyces sp. NPDC001642]|uniref:hypothetical protein n=1 Tax=Streptomyces sp. NPDC001642 TaxID=3154392 RepID=UPI00332ED9FE
MSHTAVPLTKNARTTRPSAPRRTPGATPRVMPLWQAMAQPFTLVDGTSSP